MGERHPAAVGRADPPGSPLGTPARWAGTLRRVAAACAALARRRAGSHPRQSLATTGCPAAPFSAAGRRRGARHRRAQNLEPAARHDARPSGLLTLTQRVSLVIQLFFVLIASNETEADRISTALDHGRGYVCTDTAQLAATFERIFQASVAPIE